MKILEILFIIFIFSLAAFILYIFCQKSILEQRNEKVSITHCAKDVLVKHSYLKDDKHLVVCLKPNGEYKFSIIRIK